MQEDSEIINDARRSTNSDATPPSPPQTQNTATVNTSLSMPTSDARRKLPKFGYLARLAAAGCSKPRFYTLNIFVLLLSLMALFTQFINGGFFPAIIASLQNQFNFSTSKMGFIFSSNDITTVFALPIISYFGTRYNKARLIGACGFVYALGAAVALVPYFLAPKYVIVTEHDSNGTTNAQLCRPISSLNSFTTTTTTQNAEGCTRNGGTWPFFVFILSQVLMSIGSAPIFPLGTTYMCDNVPERYHAVYTGNSSKDITMI